MSAPTTARTSALIADRTDETARLLRAAATAVEPERKRLHDEVVRLNLGVAESIARRFRHRGEPFEDLLQVACVGLTKAVQGFDPDKGHDFLSYAVPTMSGEVKRYFRDLGWAVRPPRRVQELQAAISSTAADLVQELNRSPRPSELAERLGVGADDITEALASDGCFTPASIDERGPGDDGYATADLLGGEDPEFERAEVVALLRPICRELGPRDRRILFLRFFRGWTQAQIAADLGVTQMQVSRLLSRILTSLRAKLDDAPETATPVAS